jgi:hypothetical protein
METKVTCKNVVIKSVSGPHTIASIAKERGINPQEVFVRIRFEHEGKEYNASNKLKFLTKDGYNTLLENAKSGKTIDLIVDTEKEFFYIDDGTTVDSLFATPVVKPEYKNDLKSLLLGG